MASVNMDKKYHIIVFGCQMNISDAERAATVLEKTGYRKTLDANEADLILIIMCSVRQSAVDRIHGLAIKFRKLKKRPKTILTGCVLKKDIKKFSDFFDYVLNIKDIQKITELLKFKTRKNKNNYIDIKPKYTSKFSANVPIMIGCDNFCSYCVVPYTRGKEISRPAEKIITDIKKLVNPTSPRLRGAREIWLLGQNVNSYKDPSKSSGQAIGFADLLKLVNKIPGNFWIRFTSSHPKDFNDEVISAMASYKKVTPYLNLPIQSGDDKVLKLMNRHYTVKEYKEKIKKLRQKNPNICLSTDIIVGFPGETKKQFENTAKLFKDIKYDMAYINKYSTRAGTVAAKLKDNVSIKEKKRREKFLTDILKKTALEHNKKLVGKETTVLIEEKRGNFWIGKNEQYKTVKVIAKKTGLIGKFIKVKITKAYEWSIEGKQ